MPVMIKPSLKILQAIFIGSVLTITGAKGFIKKETVLLNTA
jgi:hypothetical protein